MTKIKVGDLSLKSRSVKAEGEFVNWKGQDFYRISDVDAMAPFFMTLVSPSDHWLFIASNGGLTAGRKSADRSLFPYYTDDKLVDNAEFTGSKTIVRVIDGNTSEAWLWEPFSDRYKGVYTTQRNLYKSLLADQLCFEEVNKDLNLRFCYQWGFSQKHGFVKQSWIENTGAEDRDVEVLDGLQNILPYGVDGLMQDRRSTLVDAYKKSELDPESGLGIFSLSSNIVDKAEPSESLMANVVWSTDAANSYLLSSSQIESFREGHALKQETFAKAVKAAYFSFRSIKLAANTEQHWCTVAEVALSSAKVAALNSRLKKENLKEELIEELEKSAHELKALVAGADGLQATGQPLVQARHYSNVLYNIMRGGLFEEAYAIDTKDFRSYVQTCNSPVSEVMIDSLDSLPARMSYQDLQEQVQQIGDPDLRRLAAEYLPLSFSRRHGDPSRPWNRFQIERFDEQGQKILNYEGNWRDIFQNWEALAYSYPRFIEGMIFKFFNATTLDGYNPYRIEKNGIDWEVIEADDPWSFIGYWGDHQIIYLLRLLEHCEKHYPGMLRKWLGESNFVYADVPYRQKGYYEILKDSQDTIDFDYELHETTEERSAAIGSDGKLVWKESIILRANLAEKILLPALTKLYNLVPEGGIWMNTQRPEWNDANNALVGNGLSMVTLYYLRRYMQFVKDWVESQTEDWQVNNALWDLFQAEQQVLDAHADTIDFSAKQRRDFMDHMGSAGESYRHHAYSYNLGDLKSITIQEISNFCTKALVVLDQSIASNRQENGIYHAYNLLSLSSDEASVERLYEMLEGQVAVLTADNLKPDQALKVLDGLKSSAMYREDQYSYLLYPDRDLPSFLGKNVIAAELVEHKELCSKLLEKDLDGVYHFKGQFVNGKELQSYLEEFAESGAEAVVQSELSFWLELYEQTFDHRAFTGRSGTFYGYEGLGSIYWHMVSKLLLAAQENLRKAKAQDASPLLIGKLVDHYYEIRAGIGANKDPELYGAFPFDAYSHTPSTAGAQQPGMTGQVKEDVLNRWAELGLDVKHGELRINPFFLSQNEFLKKGRNWRYRNNQGNWQVVELSAGELAFTYCSTLFVYRMAKASGLSIYSEKGLEFTSADLRLNTTWSQALFNREASLNMILVELQMT